MRGIIENFGVPAGGCLFMLLILLLNLAWLAAVVWVIASVAKSVLGI